MKTELGQNNYRHVMKRLGLDENQLIQRNVDHFTEEEGEGRDQMVLNYFGETGLEDLIEVIVSSFTQKDNITFLDLGTGSGTFFIPVINQLKPRIAAALDITPLMLDMVQRKYDKLPTELQNNTELIKIIGDMEQVSKSIEINREFSKNLPTKFTHILSTLAIHHIPDTEKVIKEIAKSLSKSGQAIVIDAILSETSKMEPSEEHAHDGFVVNEIKTLSETYFNKVELSQLDIKCHESASKAGTDLFLMKLEKPKL